MSGRQWWTRAAVLGVPALVALLLTWPLALWDTLEKRYGGGAWDWVERGSWFATIIPALLLFVVWFRRPRADRSPESPAAIPQLALVPVADLKALISAEPAEAEPAPSGERVINQHTESNRLETALADDRSAVIMVHGEPGVGKTVLVRDVLRRTGRDEAGAVRRIELTPRSDLSVNRLLEALEGRHVPLRGLHDPLSRLTAVLEDPRAEPLVLWIDNAQWLVDHARQHLRNMSFEEALSIVAERRARPVKIVLAFVTVPERRSRQPWPRALVRIAVNHLDPQHFREYLSRLESTSRVRAGAVEQLDLHAVLHGVPRLAELFYSALSLPGNQLTAKALARRLAQRPDHVEAVLAQHIIQSLDAPERRVVAGLASFGIPVSRTLLAALLGGTTPPDAVGAALESLVDARVVAVCPDRHSGERRYLVPNAEIHKAMDSVPDGTAALLEPAAEILTGLLDESAGQARSVEELDPHFAALDAWVRAEVWDAAFELIEQLDPALSRWRCTELLTPYRARVAGHLADADEEMRNANDLGWLYLTQGLKTEAAEAFALAKAQAARTSRHVEGLGRIYLNLAELHWRDSDFPGAREHFRTALGIADEFGFPLDRMAAQAGLADCSRHWGDHAEAVRLGREALSIALFEKDPQAVRYAIRLARWHSELKNPAEASAFMAEAVQLTRRFEEGRPLLRAQLLDAQADLASDGGDHEEAERLARQAVTRALDLYDAATVLQSRTTLGWIFLNVGRLEDAAEFLDGAMRFRPDGHALVVLGLNALTAVRLGRRDIARESFAALRRQSAQRRRDDPGDFSAAEFEGLALAGERALRGVPLDAAVEAFGRARKAVPAPAPRLAERLHGMLGLLAPDISAADLGVLRAAAAGTNDHAPR
ncbi:tetratricopeptide repeat protein [Actinoplanes philippinensis]|uniref:tetratricopeptide repeat protein n=1 Tax=Actinoplanes philippinensis TaxID=35752 RepID=UPI0033F0F478